MFFHSNKKISFYFFLATFQLVPFYFTIFVCFIFKLMSTYIYNIYTQDSVEKEQYMSRSVTDYFEAQL